MSCIKRRILEILLLALCGSLQADVTITQLANEGVILADGEIRIMIDGMVVDPYSIYGGLPPSAASQLQHAEGPFSAIDLALVSHRHHDHNQPEHACRFLQASEQTRFKGAPQVLGLMREKCRQFVTTSPRVEEIVADAEHHPVFQLGNANVSVFPLSHGVRKYARIQNYGYLVEMGGVSVLHIGDAAMTAADFDKAGLRDRRIDVALIPYWYFQPGPGEAMIREFLDAPYKIAVHIPPGEMAEVKGQLQENYPNVTVLENPLDMMRISAPRSSPP
jgi:L-ascorbate metabolism protein UlaG (beta-lactamase superfamily)